MEQSRIVLGLFIAFMGAFIAFYLQQYAGDRLRSAAQEALEFIRVLSKRNKQLEERLAQQEEINENLLAQRRLLQDTVAELRKKQPEKLV
jgi:hypothetical protein